MYFKFTLLYTFLDPGQSQLKRSASYVNSYQVVQGTSMICMLDPVLISMLPGPG